MTDETIAPDAPSALDAAPTAGGDDSPTATLGAVIEEAREKKWMVSLNKKAEELFTEVLRREPIEAVIAIGAELPVNVFENVVKRSWPKLKPADREEFVTELGKLSAEKGVIKQVAAAEKIARSGEGGDPRLAAELLYAFVGPVGPEGVKLPKYKAEPLQRRFLLATSDWPKPWCEEPEKMKSLLAAFIAVADDPKLLRGGKSKAALYGFARWAGAVISMLPPGDPARDQLAGQVMTLGAGLPGWEDQVGKAASAADSDTPQAGARTGEDETRLGQDRHRGELIEAAQSPVEGGATPGSESAPEAASPHELARRAAHAIDGRTSAAATVRPTSDPVAGLLGSIEAIKAGLGLIEQLNRSLGETRSRNERLESALSEAEAQAAGLRSANAELEQRATEVARQLSAARGEADAYKSEAGSIRAKLEDERAGRAEDVKRLSEQIEREKQFALSGFKGKLTGALRPIFDNKRTTDGFELSSDLAGFFRRWFDEVEEKLKASGIQLS